MASSSTQPGATANNLILTPVMTLEGHEPWDLPFPVGDHKVCKDVSCISYFPNGKQMISGSRDKTIRRWDLREGKEIEDAREVCENRIDAVGVSRDGRWVVTAGRELKVSEVKTGIVRTFHEGRWIDCIDISADSTLLAGGSWNTAWIWSLDTGKLVAGPFDLTCGGHYNGSPILRLSENSRKLAVMSSFQGQWLQVWDVQTQKLDVSRKSTASFVGLPVPVFWTTKDKSIVAAFSFTRMADQPRTIYEFDPSTLKTVGAPFKGHNFPITSLALSFDCVLLASASYRAINLWAFESRQLLASFDVQLAPRTLILSPDSRQLAYTTRDDTKICICNIPANILASIGLEEPQPSTSKSKRSRRADVLNSDATRRRKPVIVPVIPPVPRLQRPSPTRDLHAFLRFLRKLHPSSRTEPRDLLDFPATSPLPPSHINPHENSRSTPAPPAIQSSAISPSTTSKSHLHRLSTWWPLHATSAIVDVPLAPGKLRIAAAGAPGEDDGLIRDEDYVSPPSPNPSSRQPPTAQTVNTGEHGNGRLCFCL